MKTHLIVIASLAVAAGEAVPRVQRVKHVGLGELGRLADFEV